jgi:hypothetical protein
MTVINTKESGKVFMGKRYNDTAGRKNIQYLDFKTWIIGISEAVVVLNCCKQI